MLHVIQSTGLTRRFGTVLAVQDLNLSIRPGTITAFLGPNGAGKTTTIRMLLGLAKSDAGTCEVLGRPPGHPEALAQIGALVEAPSLYEHLTGSENMEITRVMRNAAQADVDRALSLVGLSQDARRVVKGYSLGMRQRLGLALALMGKPQLLILDEPTNGLDPMGIQEIRELIRRLPIETGATIFVSSHILAEMEQVADDVVVVHHGRLRYQGPMASMGSTASTQIMVRVGDPERAVQQLAILGFEPVNQNGRLFIQAPESEAPRIAAGLVGANIDLYELSLNKVNLESRFMSLLEGE